MRFVEMYPTPTPRFDFYEEVRVKKPDAEGSSLCGKIGIVMGRTLTQDNCSWYYAVDLLSSDEGWCFYEHELETTGRKLRREDFYDGSSVQVRARMPSDEEK